MIEYNQILILIESFAIFFQGFSFRRRNVLAMLISSFIILLMSGLFAILNGAGTYVNILSNIDRYDVIIATAYVLFWWVFGYIVGGFQRITAENVKVIKVR